MNSFPEHFTPNKMFENMVEERKDETSDLRNEIYEAMKEAVENEEFFVEWDVEKYPKCVVTKVKEELIQLGWTISITANTLHVSDPSK